MKSLWVEDGQLQFRTNVPLPQVQAGEALLRVRLAGVCSTDLEILRGYYPFRGIPGHEFVGEVVQADDEPAWVGQRVVGEINLTCGECAACRAGRAAHCERRQTLGIHGRDGVFADYVALPLRNLHRVPHNISDDAAVFVEPLAAALEIQQQVQVRPGQRVLVVGAGRLGLLVAQTLALTGCALQVVARRDFPRSLLAGWGIESVTEEDVPQSQADLVVDTSGTPAGFELARRAVRPRGTLVIKSTYKGDLLVDMSRLVVDEITLVGSRCGPFAPALRLLAQNKVDPLPLISARYPLAQGMQAFEHAAQPGVLKVLLLP